MNWNAINAISTAISMVAFIVTALYVRAELKALEKDRYLAITNQLFAIWQTREFMDSQLWLMHRLEETTWQDFVHAHRADAGEAAFHRVGAFYNRVGTLVRLGLIDQMEILPTVGAYAIAVWGRIELLVQEARRLENSALFEDFERLLPSCRECYVPGAGPVVMQPFSLGRTSQPPSSPAPKISLSDLQQRLDRGKPLTVLDVRRAAQVAAEPRTLPGAVVVPVEEVEGRFAEVPSDRDVVVYCA